ncbi:MarR family winged helix-turn-helix transcriptional regulator [Saccharolobus islandicus]|uniref:HTH-type transcriptional regulator SarZ n=3 Tax=Saccharolobus islandicus TaxID=43080 RepID=M9UE65_SACIS|nr:MarR family transcriptional regulator [Sulfolobus islandicus]ADX82452.1 transcriptional regulator, MarR family [Sulfolobus islandicus HVE10/4]ADX85083.1 transcriptional regulator, MarR family [Sulfolobus islandicus REY15A]AGJ62475.1 Transcriptional regulators [Sulfolobus islandicus LAL14/1]WCM36258.1 MarR family transcriptional regulator [Sulfolobus islandicus]
MRKNFIVYKVKYLTVILVTKYSEVWDLITGLTRKINKETDKALEQIGLSYFEFKVMCALEEEGKVPMSRIAEKYMLTKAGLTSIIDRLEEKELVRRVRSESDRRVIYVELTEKGREKLIESRKIFLNVLSSFLSKLSEDEIKELERIFSKLFS